MLVCLKIMSVVDIKNECIILYIYKCVVVSFLLLNSLLWILKSQFSLNSQIKPLHDEYENEVRSMIWEQLNRFWAESYEACKASSQKRNMNLMESRRKFQVCYTFSIFILFSSLSFIWHWRTIESDAKFNIFQLINWHIRLYLVVTIISKKFWRNGECDKMMRPID